MSPRLLTVLGLERGKGSDDMNSGLMPLIFRYLRQILLAQC